MSFLLWLALGAALGVASPFLVLQLRRRADAARAGTGVITADAVRPRNPFAAVSIRPSASPCAAVREVDHQRFLAARAPPLPVAGCDRKSCGCRYVRHADRRSRGDRRDSFARFGGITPKLAGERRAGADDRRGSTPH